MLLCHDTKTRYKELAEENRYDKRIETFQDAGKGFDETIRTWLDAKSEFTLHCAVLYNHYKELEAPKYLALLKQFGIRPP